MTVPLAGALLRRTPTCNIGVAMAPTAATRADPHMLAEREDHSTMANHISDR